MSDEALLRLLSRRSVLVGGATVAGMAAIASLRLPAHAAPIPPPWATADGQAEDAVRPLDTSVSQNGWPASPDRDEIGIRTYGVDGSSITLPVKSGDVATILMYVANRFNAEVEALGSDSYGYSYRYIAGTNVLSNHASGTALDLNATRHPQGAHSSFTSVQEGIIRDILDTCQDVVRWGGDYTSTVDEMHFEINVLPTDPLVADVARDIRSGKPDEEEDMKLFTAFKQAGRASVVTLDFAGRFVYVGRPTYDLLVRHGWISDIVVLQSSEIDLLVAHFPAQPGSLTAAQIKALR